MEKSDITSLPERENGFEKSTVKNLMIDFTF